ncbi:MAG: FAD-dependent oxidoreductase [Anaerolineae bacterium]|nr:FAD-dependent oxidoreductase [Anaerolineae bacterium]
MLKTVAAEEEFDLVVLVVGFGAPLGARALGQALGVELNEYGFAVTDPFAPETAGRPGVLVAGAFREPKDIPETVVEASAVAAAAAVLTPLPASSGGDTAAGGGGGIRARRAGRRLGVATRGGLPLRPPGEIGEVIDLEAVAERGRFQTWRGRWWSETASPARGWRRSPVSSGRSG